MGQFLEDEKIIELYWVRDQRAITCSQQKYGAYCHKIAQNVLHNESDCEECMNDTWFRAWNSMPTERPGILQAFLGAITRNLSLDRYRKNHSKKRGEGEISYIYEEMQDCISGENMELHVENMELAEMINRFLAGMKTENRRIFVRRYWYFDSIAEIAKRFSISESKVKSSLMRSRAVSYTHLRAHETDSYIVCRLLLEKKTYAVFCLKKKTINQPSAPNTSSP